MSSEGRGISFKDRGVRVFVSAATDGECGRKNAVRVKVRTNIENLTNTCCEGRAILIVFIDGVSQSALLTYYLFLLIISFGFALVTGHAKQESPPLFLVTGSLIDF